MKKGSFLWPPFILLTLCLSFGAHADPTAYGHTGAHADTGIRHTDTGTDTYCGTDTDAGAHRLLRPEHVCGPVLLCQCERGRELPVRD